jgi:glycine/D-amino acid oxidase-like deaminating enzyme
MDAPQAPVLICGSGLTALATASCLAESGVKCARIAAGPAEIGEHGPGFAALGLMDPISRVALGVGDGEAADLWRYSLSGLTALEALLEACDLKPTVRGGLRIATRAVEARDLEDSAALRSRFGLPGRLTNGPSPGHSALETDAEFAFPLRDLLATLGRRLEQRGVLKLPGEAARVTVEGDVACVATRAGQRHTAEIVVVACGAYAARILPALASSVIAIRCQGFRGPMPEPALPDRAINAMYSHVTYTPEPGGLLTVTGMRPDTRGEDLDLRQASGTTKSFQETLRRLAAAHLGRPGPALEASSAFGVAAALTADGLPQIGPLGGTERVLVATGFATPTPSWGTAAARSIASLIASGTSDIPALLAPRRRGS